MTSGPRNWVNCCSRCRAEFSWVQLSSVELSWVELCRYKHPFSRFWSRSARLSDRQHIRLTVCLSVCPSHAGNALWITSLSKTIRKPPLVKAQTALKNQKYKIWRKTFSIWRMELLHPAMWHDHDIDFARWLHPAMCMWLWNHDSDFTKWQHPAMWQVAVGWHAMEFAKTSAILEFYIWLRFGPYHRSRHVILHQSAKFYPNRTTLSRKNMTSCRFSTWRISWYLGNDRK